MKFKIISTSRVKILTLLLISSFLLIQSCKVQLISDYDEITDKTVTLVQDKVSNYFVKLERVVGTEAGDYKNFTSQFDTIKVNLNTLEIRANAIEKNRIVKEQIAELKNMVKELEALHKTGITSKELIEPLKQPFNSAFTSIIKLQLALKRGEKTQ